MLKVGVVGATGYTGGEIIKILLGHKEVKVTALQAVVEREEPFSSIFPFYKGRLDIMCGKPDPDGMAGGIDLAFLALPHRVSMVVAPAFLSAGRRVIDLSADYRLPSDVYSKWYGVEHKNKGNISSAIYGLPELYFDRIKTAKLLANPGCYPTGAMLGIIPAILAGAVSVEGIVVDAKSGATGAGRKADIALSFCEINENFKAYKINEHQHKPEIDKILSDVSGKGVDVIFVPHLVPMNRGILSTIYMKLRKGLDTSGAIKMYRDFYAGKPFVRISDEGKLPQTRDVWGMNYCDIGLKVTGNTLVAVSCIDNLVKGAAGQAVQNMNIMCGFDESEGLI